MTDDEKLRIDAMACEYQQAHVFTLQRTTTLAADKATLEAMVVERDKKIAEQDRLIKEYEKTYGVSLPSNGGNVTLPVPTNPPFLAAVPAQEKA